MPLRRRFRLRLQEGDPFRNLPGDGYGDVRGTMRQQRPARYFADNDKRRDGVEAVADDELHVAKHRPTQRRYGMRSATRQRRIMLAG